MSRSESRDVQERGNACHTEWPLPTYEEVIASEGENRIGLKTNVLLGTSSVLADRGDRTDRRTANRADGESRYEQSFISSKKVTILMLVGLLLIPMCVTIIIFQVKACSLSDNQKNCEINTTNYEYRRCVDEKNDIQRQFDALMNNVESNKLLQDYKDAFGNKEILQLKVRELREQLKTLTAGEEKLQWILKNVDKAFLNPAESNNHDVHIKKSNTDSNLSEPSDSEQKDSPTERPKTQMELLDEFLDKAYTDPVRLPSLIDEAEGIFISKNKKLKNIK